MESLHISVSRAVNDGEWSDDNLENLIRILNCFHLASGLKINVHKSQVLGVGVPPDIVNQGASRIGCAVMQTPFKYLGVMVGDHMSRYSAWSNTIQKVRARLSKWKVKTLSVGGRLTLLKSVLGAVPVYNMSIYKAPKGVLHEMEMLRNKFFNGADSMENKITTKTHTTLVSPQPSHGDLHLPDPITLTKSIDLPSIQIHRSPFNPNPSISLQSNNLTLSLLHNALAYGKVVDVFIPNRKSKAGKRFAFVRFIRVDDMERLIGNLCTLWVGRFHLHANAVRYERSNKPPPSVRFPPPQIHKQSGSYATAVKDFNSPPVISSPVSSSPALVLDDTCVNADDLSRHVMGRVKDLNSIPNLLTILTKEGFAEVKLSYLGGLWVMIELKNEKTKRKLLQHTGANSWFHDLQAATLDFVSDERVVWVDIEGIPLSFWSHATFSKIGKKWGEVMDIE
ncbi:RNA-directed DNA polymerase, eukaryota, partial [Tanacetum coccineum]